MRTNLRVRAHTTIRPLSPSVTEPRPSGSGGCHALRGILCVATCLVTASSFAQTRTGLDLPDDSPIVTHHKISIENKTLAYTARAGFLSLFDDSRELKARIFYVAYTLDGAPTRPLTFAWN